MSFLFVTYNVLLVVCLVVVRQLLLFIFFSTEQSYFKREASVQQICLILSLLFISNPIKCLFIIAFISKPIKGLLFHKIKKRIRFIMIIMIIARD